MDSLCLKAGIHGVAAPIAVAGGASVDVRASLPSHFNASLSIPQMNSPWRLSFSKSRCAVSRRRFGAVSAGDDVVLIDENDEERNAEKGTVEEQNDNWVMKILRVRSLRNGGGEKSCGLGDSQAEKIEGQFSDDAGESRCSDADDISAVDDDDEIEFDRNSFSKLLCRVSLKEARLYAQMSYLGNLAYSIPQIKPRNLLRYHGLRFVTSSLEKKEQALKTEREMVLSEEQMKKEEEVADMNAGDVKEHEADRTSGIGISASAAYQIAASAASYLLSHTKSILPFRSPQVDGDTPKRTIGRDENVDFRNEEVASLMATTDSVTAVVAAKEEVKQAVADDLSSTRLSPCQWFVCDDDRNATRFFVIQGSESLASWQANLLFEPTQFEGMDVLVHRGIYEAAKGMYEQMLPEVRDHLKSYGHRALFRFTGHSLGGSLSLLVSLMLLTREEVPPSSLLPVITFGSPTIMCGGDRLLKKLGLPRSHVQSIMMHRDIVPRAFSCSYPIHVAELLKAVNGSFRNHPCLNNQKLLYAPMGDFLILQPNDKFSPSHHLLPSGPGLYLLSCPVTDDEADKRILSARSVFLNSPHPLEILSDRSAYGSGGAIQRDHDMKSYLKCIRNIIREELNRIRKAKREHRRRVWWPLIVIPGVNNAGIVVGELKYHGQLSFAGIFHSGKESVKRFTVVAGQHMHFFLMFLLPAPLLILRVFNVITFR